MLIDRDIRNPGTLLGSPWVGVNWICFALNIITQTLLCSSFLGSIKTLYQKYNETNKELHGCPDTLIIVILRVMVIRPVVNIKI